MGIKQKRLESLDILRGMDLFILVCFQPVFMRWAQVMGKIAGLVQFTSLFLPMLNGRAFIYGIRLCLYSYLWRELPFLMLWRSIKVAKVK